MKHARWEHVIVLALLVLLCRATAAAPAPAVAPAAAPPAVQAAPDDLARMADEVAKEVEALRGWKFKHPIKKQVCSPEFVRTYLDKQIDKQVPPDKVAESQAFLRTIGLLPPGVDLKKTYLDILQGQVGGFYDTETKTLYLVRRGKSSAVIDRIVLAHELTHALDDQQVDLDAFAKPRIGQTEDMDLVVSSVMEGSATSLMTQYMTRTQLSGSADPAELLAYAEGEAENTRKLMEAPRYFTSMIGAYLCGIQFLTKGGLIGAMLAPDNQATGRNFLAAIKDPPRSTEQILHPEKYWEESKRDEPVIVNDDAVAKMLAQRGRWIVHKDTVGEMLVAILTTPQDSKPNLMFMQMSDAWTNTAAKGWGGDRFYLLASGTTAAEAAKALKDLKGVWITLWDTPKDREEFVDAYDKNATAAHGTFRLGNMGAVIFYGFDEAERKALESRFEKSPPPMTRAGKPWAPWAL
jgi:hypothetical protein